MVIHNRLSPGEWGQQKQDVYIPTLSDGGIVFMWSEMNVSWWVFRWADWLAEVVSAIVKEK